MPGYAERFQIRSRADLEKCLAHFRAKEKHSEDMSLCIRMSVCPVGLIDAFSWEAWALFSAIKNGVPWPWPGGFYQQPSVYAAAAKIFESELNAIKQERELREQSGRTGKV